MMRIVMIDKTRSDLNEAITRMMIKDCESKLFILERSFCERDFEIKISK